MVFSMVHTSWIECRNSVARLAGDARKALLFGETAHAREALPHPVFTTIIYWQKQGGKTGTRMTRILRIKSDHAKGFIRRDPSNPLNRVRVFLVPRNG